MPDPSSTHDHAARRLTVYYVCALSAVACLAIAGQGLVQKQLSRQLTDSKVVNLAGRQRMLGQRTCKCTALLIGGNASIDRGHYEHELTTLLPTWRRTHLALQQGDADAGLPGDNSRAVAEVFSRLNPTFDAMYAAAERLLVADDSAEARRAAHELLNHEAAYLQGMDEIVSQYEGEGRARVERLRFVERVLLGLTLTVLLLEGVLVFRPAARSIRGSFAAVRRTSVELQRAKDAAEAADRAKSQFLANLSHELRTPLHAVLGSAELLRQSTSQADRDDCLNVIEDSGRMLFLLLNDLLDLSKIEAGKLELHPRTLDLRDFARRTMAMFAASADAKGLELRCITADDEWPTVTADPLRLRQVLANLLNNAVKYTDAGTVTLEIALLASSTERATLRFAVVDTGIGIPDAEQCRIFESFTQLRLGDVALGGGVGLGLCIAARLVARMGGKLEVQSKPGRGSTFSFTIDCPIIPETAEDVAAPPAATIVLLRVLAAEDAPAVRRIIESLLIADGHRTRCVADGRQAVAAFQTEPFDLVLLDLRMPDVDGLAAAAAMRDWERSRGRRRTPIVALTAAAPSTLVADASLVDFDGFVLKPFSGEQLRCEIQRHSPQCNAATDSAVEGSNRAGRALERLRGRQDLLDELVELFLSDAPQLRNEIEAARLVGDWKRLKTAVHRLRGQLEMLEVRDVAEFAQRLETACEADEPLPLQIDLTQLHEAWPDMCRRVALLASTRNSVVGSL